MSAPVVIYQTVTGRRRDLWHIVAYVLDGKTYHPPTPATSSYLIRPLCAAGGNPVPVVPTTTLSTLPDHATLCFGCLKQAVEAGDVTITVHERAEKGI